MSSDIDLGQVSIRRSSLLAALDRSRPKILVLVAPAGFGKSTLVRQVIENRVASGICDCTGVTGELDFARRIVPVLAEQEPGSGASLAQTELMLADGATTPAQGVALGIAAWRAATRASTFVFENAEHVVASASARDLLIRLLADLPEGRSIIICTREPLRIHLSRFAPPHRIVTLRANELEFSRDEIEAILGSLGASDAMVERIVYLSQGWPIAVFLLARFLQEGRLVELLDRLNDVAFEDLHDYLADQVLEALDQDITSTLFACACIPSATREDLVVATGSEDAVQRFTVFEKTSPFVTKSETGSFVVHPLLATMMLERDAARGQAILAATAAEFEGRHDYLRSSELHLARGAQVEAARVLEIVLVTDDHTPSMRYARLLASLDRELVRNYPTLWSCGAVLQMFSTNSEKLLAENTQLFGRMTSDLPAQRRYFIVVTRVLLLTYLGKFEAALAIVESFAPRAKVADIPEDTVRGYALYLHGLVAARMGRLDSAERDLVAAYPLVKSMDILGSAVLMILGADIERPRGNREKERQLLERAIEATRPSEMANILAQRLAEATFGAWLAGEDESFAEYQAALAEIVNERGIRGFAFFSDRARRGFNTEPDANDLPKWIVCGHLIAFGDVEDVAGAALHARAALEAARAHATPHLIALSALALAEISAGSERAVLHEEARAAAAVIESLPFARAVDLAIGGRPEVGMLTPFFERRVRSRGRPPAPRLEVQILSGTVRTRGVAVALPDRELALLLGLASRRQPIARETLTELLWPELDEVAARNALHVCLHRLRQRLGDESLVVRTTSGYRLCDEARVDLWDIGHAATAIRSREELSEHEARELRELLQRLRFESVQRFANWEWFRTIERRVQELRSEISRRLASLALSQDRVNEALALAQETIDLDPCDEPAHELAIVAYLRKDDQASALRQFRHYRDTLWEELQCAPSARLAALVGAGVEAQRASVRAS
jgi:DNA-binding SARP family transcriptional activator